MGYKLDTCSCYKKTEDTAIEVELKSGEKQKIKIVKDLKKFSIKKMGSKKEIKMKLNKNKKQKKKKMDKVFMIDGNLNVQKPKKL